MTPHKTMGVALAAFAKDLSSSPSNSMTAQLSVPLIPEDLMLSSGLHDRRTQVVHLTHDGKALIQIHV